MKIRRKHTTPLLFIVYCSIFIKYILGYLDNTTGSSIFQAQEKTKKII